MNGDLEQAEAVLNKMKERRNFSETWSATSIGLGLATMGRIEEAASYLVQANRERDFWLRWHLKSFIEDMPALGVHPMIEKLLLNMGLDDATIEQRIARAR